MEEDTVKSKNGLGIQETLSLGYIYLLILGVIHNAIFYNFIGVSYFDNSSILDVLLSPISLISSSFMATIALVGFVIVSFIYVKIIVPFIIKRSRKKEKNQSGKKLKQLDALERATKSNYALLFIVALFVFGYFIGFGFGGGSQNKKLIEEGKIVHNTRINFINGKSIEAKLLGKNSLNIFYIQKGDKTVSISPVDGNVMTVQKLDKKK